MFISGIHKRISTSSITKSLLLALAPLFTIQELTEFCLAGIAKKNSYCFHLRLNLLFPNILGNISVERTKQNDFLILLAKYCVAIRTTYNDCRITRHTYLRLIIIHRFQYIIKKYVHCNGFYNHGQFVDLAFKHPKDKIAY
jgi:hypothetical protein